MPRMWVTQPPSHGVAQVRPSNGVPRFPPSNPYARCNDEKVSGMSIDYTPAANFTGTDALAFDEVNGGRPEQVFRIAITVK